MKHLKLLNFLFVPLVALFLSGCFDAPTGPEDIAWDYDTCARCHMVVSDHLFVAQIRVPDQRRTLKFDDLGGAPLWMETSKYKDNPDVEIWVSSHDSTREKTIWLDAQTAWYVPGYNTPMDFGFAAFEDKVEGAVNYEAFTLAAQAKALARKMDKTGGHKMPGHMNHTEHMKQMEMQ